MSKDEVISIIYLFMFCSYSTTTNTFIIREGSEKYEQRDASHIVEQYLNICTLKRSVVMIESLSLYLLCIVCILVLNLPPTLFLQQLFFFCMHLLIFQPYG